MSRLMPILFVFLFANLAACTRSERRIIRIDGSSTVYPISEAIAEEYLVRSPIAEKYKVTVGISGTGGGFKKFCRGDIDIAGASRPISEKEIKICKEKEISYYELPIAFDATVVVVHKDNPLNEITVGQLKKMWHPDAQAKIKSWDQVEPSWKKQPLLLFGAGSDSGTFDYFTEAVVGKAKSSRGDYTASEDDNTIVNGVSGEPGALGYLPFAYYQENREKLKALAIVNPQNKAVLPSSETVENASYTPLSRPLFIYVNAKASENPKVKEFIQYYIQTTRGIAGEVKYVPFSENDYAKINENFLAGKLGTVFNGHSLIGLTIRQLLEKESAPLAP